MADPACQFRLEILYALLSIERFVVTKKSNDDIGFQSVQPLIGRGVGAKTSVTRSPSILGLVEGFAKGLRSRKTIGVGSSGVGAKTGCIACISHVPHHQTVGGKALMDGRLQMALMLHSSRQSVAYENDMLAGLKAQRRVVGARARDSSKDGKVDPKQHDAVEHDGTIGMASILAQVWKSPSSVRAWE